MARRIKLKLKIDRYADPERVGRRNRAIVKLLCPEVFDLRAEADALMGEIAAYEAAQLRPEEIRKRNRIAELERELAALKGEAA